MPVFRWGQTWHAFHDLEREVDRLLSSVNLTLHGIRLRRQYPAVNLYELDHEFLLTAEVAGTRREDLEVTIAGGILTIKGKRGDVEGVPEDRFRRHERFHGAWQRSLTIPDRVQEGRLSAEFNHGILKIHLPKAEAVAPRQIPVAEGSE
jgi:HSP20 family protein